MSTLPEGFRQLNDFEIAAILKAHPRDTNIRLLVGDYQRLRNIEALNVTQRSEGETMIDKMVANTSHLTISDKIIVACNEILALRAELDTATGEVARYLRLWCGANELMDKKNARIHALTVGLWIMIVLFLINTGVILWLSRCVQAGAAGS